LWFISFQPDFPKDSMKDVRDKIAGAPGTLNTLPRFRTDEGKARYAAAYDAVLREWPVPYEQLELPTRLGPTHVIASGSPDAPPLVLLSSLAGTATVWRLNAAELSRHYRVYAVDVIGQPGKSAAYRRIRSRREFAGWFTDLLDALSVERTSIVGCSFGGFLALNQASLTPERVDKVVLISPAGTFVRLSWKFLYVMQIKRPILRFMRRLTGSTRSSGLANIQRKGAPLPRDTKWSALMAVTASESPKMTVIYPSVFSKRQLRAIRAPALLLIGDRERLYEPHKTLRLALDRMPGLQGAIISDADHIAAMAQPADVNERIIRFLQRSAGP
jgi:pimeloyl-ACP methyl ester carboxylesterase